MVCIPCILLPLALWIYHKFLHPLIWRVMPENWRAWLDNKFYPTCPVKPPPPATNGTGDKSVNDPATEDIHAEEQISSTEKVGADHEKWD